jgi:hypothetical protein
MVGENVAEAARNGLAAIGEAMAKPVVIEFGGDGLHLYGRKRGKTDNRCLLKRLEVPAWLVAVGAASAAVGTVLALGKAAEVIGVDRDGAPVPAAVPGPGQMIVEAMMELLSGVPAANLAARAGGLMQGVPIAGNPFG